jgi:hypothetical protein
MTHESIGRAASRRLYKTRGSRGGGGLININAGAKVILSTKQQVLKESRPPIVSLQLAQPINILGDASDVTGPGGGKSHRE